MHWYNYATSTSDWLNFLSVPLVCEWNSHNVERVDVCNKFFSDLKGSIMSVLRELTLLNRLLLGKSRLMSSLWSKLVVA